MLTELVAMFGAKFCCIAAAGTGGVCNAAVRRKTPVRDILLSVIIGWIAAEFFIPMLVEQFELGVYTALAIAFFIGYSGIRLLPHLEDQVFKRLDNVIGGAEEDKDKKENLYASTINASSCGTPTF